MLLEKPLSRQYRQHVKLARAILAHFLVTFSKSSPNITIKGQKIKVQTILLASKQFFHSLTDLLEE